MSESEKKIADTRGKFALVVKSGRQINDASWRSGRILLSNKRLVLVGSSGKKTIPLSAIEELGDRFDVNNEIARETEYTSLRLEDRVILVTVEDDTNFKRDLYVALLDREIINVRHPAVVGGVIQDTEWEDGRFKLKEDTVAVATQSGTFVEVSLDDIATLETEEQTVEGEEREVIEVEHTDEDEVVQTYFTGESDQVSFMRCLFQESQERHEADLDLSRSEKQVLMALYSGVSFHEIPGFTGMSVEDVEETFDRLIDLDVLDVVRERSEVTLTTRGRTMAGDISGDE